jgi:hypothetical protein
VPKFRKTRLCATPLGCRLSTCFSVLKAPEARHNLAQPVRAGLNCETMASTVGATHSAGADRRTLRNEKRRLEAGATKKTPRTKITGLSGPESGHTSVLGETETRKTGRALALLYTKKASSEFPARASSLGETGTRNVVLQKELRPRKNRDALFYGTFLTRIVMHLSGKMGSGATKRKIHVCRVICRTAPTQSSFAGPFAINASL